jgi:hypothetical protein
LITLISAEATEQQAAAAKRTFFGTESGWGLSAGACPIEAHNKKEERDRRPAASQVENTGCRYPLEVAPI